MEAKAQTILQLYAQLERQGFDPEAMQRVHRAYAFTVSRCTCQYRSSGRTLLDHAVGDASILAGATGDPTLVVAGIVHVAYLHGDFGTWRRRILPTKRAALERVVGRDAERLVYEYSLLTWNATTIRSLQRRVENDDLLRTLALMRLADVLDIYGEHDALYCSNVRKRRMFARELGPTLVALAEALERPQLATRLARAFAEVASGNDPRVLIPAWHNEAIWPLSYRPKWPITVYQGMRERVYRLSGR